MENSPLARPLTTRFIAGLTLEDAVRVASELQRQRVFASLDYLGENVKTLEEASAARDAYLAAIRTVYPLQGTVSMKVTALAARARGLPGEPVHELDDVDHERLLRGHLPVQHRDEVERQRPGEHRGADDHDRADLRQPMVSMR